MSQLPAAGYLNNASRTEGEMKTAFEDQLAGIKQIPGAPTAVAAATLTIASGSVTPSGGAGAIFLLDTEAAAATDDLTNIIQTNLPEPGLLLLGLANAARVVVAKHSAGGAGQISLRTGGDFVLGDVNHWLLLKRTGTLWEEIWRFPDVPVHAVLTKTANYTVTVADRNKLIDGTANTWTLTLLAAATAGKGFLLPAKNSGSGFITIDPNGAETVDGAATLVLMPGDEILLECDGSNWKSMSRYRPAVSSYKSVGQDSKNNAGTPNTQFDLDADQVVLFNPSDGTSVVRDNPGAITNNVSTAGPAANGRDQAGAFSASSWIHFYWIWNGSTLATISSATAPSTGPTLPTGYTHWAYAGAVRFNGSSQLVKTQIKGNIAYYEAAQNVLSAGTASSETAITITSVVPPNALSFMLFCLLKGAHTVSGAGEDTAKLRVVTGVNYVDNMNQFSDTPGNPNYTTAAPWLPNLSQTLYYILTRGSSGGTAPNFTVDVQAYQLPNGGG